MKLIDSAPSPFCRKIKVILHETGLIDQVELAQVTNTPIAPEAENYSHNPLGKIPTLIRDDGPALYDSRVISRYLDTLAQSNLYPENRIWETLTLEATADGILDAAVLMVYEKRFREPNIVSEDWLAAQWEKVERGLKALEARWMSHLNGRLDAGQIGVGCALGYLDFRHPDRDWRVLAPELADWFEKFAARPSMKATLPS